MVSCDDLNATSALVPIKQQLSRHPITSKGEVETPLSTVPCKSRKHWLACLDHWITCLDHSLLLDNQTC